MRQRFKRVLLPKIRIYILLVLAVFLIVVGFKAYKLLSSVSSSTGLTPDTVSGLLFDHGTALKQDSGRTNILLLGIGGGDHAGADLTDTMMVISLKLQNGQVSMISIPRDIWSDTLKDKVNSAYHYGEEKKKGGGLVLSKVTVEDVVGLPIHYAMLIDFSGFERIIDLAGGVDVDVTKGFTDTQYPIAGREIDTCGGDPTFACRYETVTFKPGIEHMDGKRALIYVRSRHAEGEEGTDFSRSRRQQEVLSALKNKFSQPSQWIQLKRNMNLFESFDQATDTDMTIGEMLTVLKIIGSNKNQEIKKIAIDKLFISPSEYLYDGRYVLIPADSYDAIHTYIRENI